MLYPRRIKDPEAALDYRFVWGEGRPGDRVPGDRPWLEDGETIATFSVTVPSGITLESSDITDNQGTILIWLSGGTLGRDYDIKCRITTTSSRTDVRYLTVSIETR
ncbi:phage fiber-tail adaptor protein [Nocardia beijingensis]